MYAVTHRVKPYHYQLALFIKKNLDDIIGTLLSACEASIQYRPHQIQVSGCPEHPTNPPGLPKITEREPKGLPRKSREIFKN